MNLIPYGAAAFLLALSGVAAWQITESPDRIDDLGAYGFAGATDDDAVRVAIDPGDDSERIGDALETCGAIASSTQFQVLVALLGYDGALQAGEYEFDRGTQALEAVYRIHGGQTTALVVPVIDGWRLEEVADAVAAQGVSREGFLVAATARNFADFAFLAALPPDTSLEGYLYPATYPIGRLEPPEDIVRRMLQAFADNVPADIEERAAAQGLTTHGVLTVASIIQREAVVDEERTVIAQVFLSRLEEGIPFEADPTVQYAVATPESAEEFGWWKAELSRADLESESLYNTYRNAGLPPGPIASPSLASIEAVLDPADTEYLYFVAKGDGTHAFAETFEEHLENVRQYQPQ